VRRPSRIALAILAAIGVALSSAGSRVADAQTASPDAALGTFCAILTQAEVSAAIKRDVSAIGGDDSSCRYLDISASSSLTGFFVSQHWGTLTEVRAAYPTTIDVTVAGQPGLRGSDGSFLVIGTDRGILTLQLLGSTGEGAEAMTALDALAATALGRLATIPLPTMVPTPGPLPSTGAGAPTLTVQGDVPPLSAWNDTDIPITVVVNGAAIALLPPASEQDPLTIPDPPPLPWTVEARASDGFVLATALVPSMDPVSYRFDLSCGRIDIWSRVPIVGPMNGPGHPGDCGP